MASPHYEFSNDLQDDNIKQHFYNNIQCCRPYINWLYYLVNQNLRYSTYNYVIMASVITVFPFDYYGLTDMTFPQCESYSVCQDIFSVRVTCYKGYTGEASPHCVPCVFINISLTEETLYKWLH